MEQKPVAWVTYSTSEWFGKANGVGVFQYEKRDDCKIPLFTADQLKAERDKAIQKCLKIAEEYRNSNYEDAGNVIYKNILALLYNNEEKPE